jgi:transposase
MTIVRQRLSEEFFAQVFIFVLRQLEKANLLPGKAFGIDATTLEANAAMKSIVRRDNGKDWEEYLRELAAAEGMENPSMDDLRRLDRKRKGKKTSNKEWQSSTDPDSRITKMKDGRTRLACKAEHSVQLDSQAIVSAYVTAGDRGDCATGLESAFLAQANLIGAGSEAEVKELVADKGYHGNDLLAQCEALSIRTYIPERQQKQRRWKDKPAEYQKAFHGNRNRVRRAKGKQLNRWRSERVERTFAHVCETGGSRRTQVRGMENVGKVHQIKCAGYNLGLLMRRLFGLRKPRNGDAGKWVAIVTGQIRVYLVSAIVPVIRIFDRTKSGLTPRLRNAVLFKRAARVRFSE